MWHEASDCVNFGGVTKVCICQLLYRVNPPSMPRGAAVRHQLRLGYNLLVDDVNREFRRLISFFHFLKHSGLLFDGYSLLINDGTNLNTNGERLCQPSVALVVDPPSSHLMLIYYTTYYLAQCLWYYAVQKLTISR